MRCIAILFFLCCSCSIADGRESKHKNHSCLVAPHLQEYSRVLDAYFINARGSNGDLVVLRVYGGRFREYEIVLDPHTSQIIRYTPEKSIWGNIYSLAKPHQVLDEYVNAALAIPYEREEMEADGSEFESLLEIAIRLDASICQSRAVPIHDAVDFEIIRNSGLVRATVTDTSGTKVRSQNTPLLNWALELRNLPPANQMK